MKKDLILLLGAMLLGQLMYAQSTGHVWTEDFDGTVSFTQQASYWSRNTAYSTSGTYSYRGRLPNALEDVVLLETPFYDLRSLYPYAQLRFRHICKVDPQDTIRIEYRFNELGIGGIWQAIPVVNYEGSAANYGISGFNAASYPQWKSEDMYAKPEVGWWKEEVFDIGDKVGNSEVQFRFVIKRGNVLGTQFSYGWLLDDFRMIACEQPILLPVIELIEPVVQDTVLWGGPFTVTADIQSVSTAPIANPMLEYTTLYDGASATQTIPMTVVNSNVWEAMIPKMMLHTKVQYTVWAEDAFGSKNSAVSGYYISKDRSKGYDSNAVSIVSMAAPLQNSITAGVATPVKVTFCNEGDYNLTQATIQWSVNGVVQTPYVWSGNLGWSYSDTAVEIGSYIPTAGKYDTLVVWATDINNLSGTDSDSLQMRFYGCNGAMSGNYLVGASGQIATLQEAITLLELCGVGGDITFAMQDGTYTGDIDLSGFGAVMGNYHLSIASLQGNRDSVVLVPTANAGIYLDNTNHVSITDITIDASGIAVPAIAFASSCTNIVIRNCVLLGNITATTAALAPAPIEKVAGTGIAKDIRITGNLIKGGYYGILFNGGVQGNYGKHIVIDSNVLTAQYYYGIYPYYNELELLYNAVYYNLEAVLRQNNNSWRGIQVGYSDGKIIGNKVYQASFLTASCGLFVLSLNQSTPQRGIIANNEIILHTGGTNYGVFLSTGTNALFVNNSVYVNGVSGTPRVAYITDNITNNYTIKNNTFTLNNSDGYAIYLVGTDYTLNYDIDYNNYYVYSTAAKIGYAGADRKTLANWQSIFTTDAHSTDMFLQFIDSSYSLEPASYTGMECPYIPEVTTDINNNIRMGITSKGAYGYGYATNDALLTGFLDWRTTTLAGQSDSVKVVLANGGDTPLSNIDIVWDFNGVQTTTSWSGILAKGESDTIFLGTITYINRDNSLMAWIKDFAVDEYHHNDTLYISNYFCDTLFNGTYIIGASGVFSTVREAMDRLSICGMNGAVTLALEDGVIDSTLDLSVYDALITTPVNSLTLTSLSQDKSKVRISPTSGVGIKLGEINNVVIKDITVDVSTNGAAYGIQFVNPCTNVVIRNCNVLASPTATSSTSAAIYKASSTGSLKDIEIKNNTISGGYSGIYLYAGIGAGAYGEGIIIDSNIVDRAYYYTIHLYYADSVLVSHNEITSRTVNTGVTWYGIYLSSVNGTVNANKVWQQSTAITNPTGIYLSGTGSLSSPLLVSNNEIYVYSTGIYYGISVASSTVYANLFHNSIYVAGSGAARGINITGNADITVNVKNNNIIMESDAGHPIYLASVAYLSQWDLDYNNYYAPLYVGYADGAGRIDMLDWQSVVPLDAHSVSYRQVFVDIQSNLQTIPDMGYSCPAVAEVPYDKTGVLRKAITAKGAYHFDAVPVDITPDAFVSLPEVSTIGDSVSVMIMLYNVGSDTLTSVDITWQVNQTVQGTIPWTGILPPEGKQNTIIGTIVVQAGDNAITVWTSNPNQQTDEHLSNDTLRGSTVACNAPLVGGVYTVGNDGDFSTLSAAVHVLHNCGTNGAVTFSLYPGSYGFLSLDSIAGVSDSSALTFLSHTGKAEDVLFSGVALKAYSNNITLEKLTIDGSNHNAAINLASPIRKITIDGCFIKASQYATTSSTTAAGVYGIYLDGTNIDHIRIVNNTIDGGYSGVHLNGGSAGNYAANNIWIDSNTLINQGYYAVQLSYSNAESISHNTILSRTTEGLYWRAIHLSNTNVSCVNANKIKQRATHSYPTGIDMTGVNNTVQDPVLITNNEIYIYSQDHYYNGIYLLTGNNAKILFNSISVGGKGCAAVAVANFTNIRLTLKYNNLFAADFCYPLYFVSTAYKTAGWDVSDNNYYSPRFIGYATNDHTSMASWVSEVVYDTTSVTIQPQFIDSTISLELADYTGIECPSIREAPTDINGMPRIGLTAMGAYTSPALPVNLALEEILNWNKHTMAGESDTIQVIIRNGGTTPITSATISYAFNGTKGLLPVWTGNLALGDADTVALAILHYISEVNQLQIWIDSLSGLVDGYLHDDTLSVSAYFCDSLFHGIYTVGATGDFVSITEAVERMYMCGIDGNVRFEIEDGHYYEYIQLTDAIPGSNSNNVVTFTSQSGDATAVKIQRPADDTETDLAPFMLDNVSNIVITKLTIDVHSTQTNTYTYAKGIMLNNGCDNIEITECMFVLLKFGSPTSTSSNYTGIYQSASPGLSNIRILNNTIDGGVCGIYFTGQSDSPSRNILIKDNRIPAADYTGIHVRYADSVVIRNNEMGQRIEAPLDDLREYEGIYAGNINQIEILQNKIQAGKGKQGIYTTHVNDSGSQTNGLIANNEIQLYLFHTSTARQGIYLDVNTRAKVYHNSVYLRGSSIGNALHVASSTGSILDIQNNILAVASLGLSYPIYIASVADLVRINLNYNNYYTATDTAVGYAGARKNNLTDWTAIIPSDTHSVSFEPIFADSSVNLDLQSNLGMTCPLLANVPVDKNDSLRAIPNTMGAYYVVSLHNDVFPYEIISPIATVWDTTDMIIRIQSVGTDTLRSLTIHWEVNGVLQTPFLWKDTLASALSKPITIGRFVPQLRNNTVVVWTSAPNGVADEFTDNDTIRKTFYRCDSIMQGAYTVGVSGDFTSITDVVKNLYACGINAPVTIEIEDGTYTELVLFSGAIPGADTFNTVTFVSASGDPATTIIQRSDSANKDVAPFILDNVSHLRISHLQLSGYSPYSITTYSYAKALIFKHGCSDIEISDCILTIPTFGNSATNSDSYTVIQKAANTGTVENIRILRNTIEGGGYGIFMRGASATERNETILIQDNTIRSVDKYGLYLYWSNNTDIINNVITQRPYAMPHDFYGMYSYYSSGNILNNRIKADSLIYGIEVYYGNNQTEHSIASIANNEIIVKNVRTEATSYSAIYIYYSKVNIVHNSVLITGSGGNACYLMGNASQPYIVKNNNFVTLDSSSYPIYLGTSTASYLAAWDINYNNYYAPVNIGYVDNAKTNLAAWSAIVMTDSNSVRILPDYIDSTTHLELSDYTGLSCPLFPAVSKDRKGLPRYDNTVMGAYDSLLLNSDASLSLLAHVPAFGIVGELYSPRVQIENLGINAVTEVVIKWAINGVINPADSATWTGTLNQLDTTTLSLGTFHALLGMNDIVAWIASVNMREDEYPANDSVRATFHTCDSLYRGIYTIGQGGDFATITDAIQRLKDCSVGGDISLELLSGTYQQEWVFTDITFMGNHLLTVTSAAHHRDSVILQPQTVTGTAITINNVTNFIVKDITIDAATKAQVGIKFTGGCTNLVITQCAILVNSFQTGTAYNAIYKGSGTGVVRNSAITHNVIDGGYEGIYFYGGVGTSYGDIRIDSNLITNNYYRSIYLYYTNAHISSNEIVSRINSNATWYGMYLNYSWVEIDANKIRQQHISNTIYGIYCLSVGLEANNPYSVIRNNEVMIAGTGIATTVGANAIYGTSSKLKMLNNSILVNGTGASRGIYLAGSSDNYDYEVKNNTIVMESADAFPIYLSEATYAQQWDINHNNYYAPRYIGSISTTVYTDLLVWKAVVSKDVFSISERPLFIDSTQHLALSQTGNLICPRHDAVLYDIHGLSRDVYTTMGAYSLPVTEYDLELAAVIEPSNAATFCSPPYLSIRYAVKNNGFANYDFAATNLELHFSMTGVAVFDTMVLLSIGNLLPFSSDTVELTDFLDVSSAGDYHITAWIHMALDTITANDTFCVVYQNRKISLPFDDDFSTPDLLNLNVESLTLDSVWTVEPASGYDSLIAPYYGTGILVFRGEFGTMTRLSTGQIELDNTQQPVLEFWYAHDDSRPDIEDQLEVRLTYDGGFNHTTLFNILRYDSAATVPIWKKYQVDLSPYQDSSCVIISFDGYSFGGTQRIDRIVISSNQDIAITKTVLPELSACDLVAKSLKVEISNTTGQHIDFDQPGNTMDLAVLISKDGLCLDSIVLPLTGIMTGLESKEMLVASNLDFSEKGSYVIKSYFTASIDNAPQNDVLIDTFIINPALSVRIVQESSGNTDCLPANSVSHPTIVLTNTGNLPLSDIDLKFYLHVGNDDIDSVFETHAINNFRPGDSTVHLLAGGYTVPWEQFYLLVAKAQLQCNPDLFDTLGTLTECADVVDIRLDSLLVPSDNKPDAAGSQVNSVVLITNTDPVKDYRDEIRITTLIHTANKEEVANFYEVLPLIHNVSDTTYTFSTPYTVPEDTAYSITVFVSDNNTNQSLDNYTTNDTIYVVRKTDYVIGITETDGSRISMSQNIPNPATGTTRIDYTIPMDGEVTFHVYTISGQELYNEVVTTTSGKHSLDLNTTSLAAGVYFYSMEFKGQRIIKRMSVHN